MPHVLDYALSPSEVQRRRFCERYLAHAGAASDSTTVEMLRSCWRKCDLGAWLTTCMGGLWGLFQAVNSTIEFDYVMYGEQCFVQLKRELALL